MIIFRFYTIRGVVVKTLKDLTNPVITPVLRLANRAEIERWKALDSAPSVSLHKIWKQFPSWSKWR